MSKDHTLKGKNRDPPDGAAGILYQGTVTYESWNNSASYTFAKNLQKNENLFISPWCLLWMAHNYPSIFQL